MKAVEKTGNSGGNATNKINAERALKQAEETRNALDVFKKDVKSYLRFYEFISQIIPFDDSELERLNVFCRHLLPLLRQELLDEEDIDLSAVVLSHYHLNFKRTQDLHLREHEEAYLSGVTGLGTGRAKEPEKDLLSQILDAINDLFGGETSEGDRLNFVQGWADKMRENHSVMDQIKYNGDDAVMKGDFPGAMDAAVIERMDIQQELSMEYLAKPEVADQLQGMMLKLIRSGLEAFVDR